MAETKNNSNNNNNNNTNNGNNSNSGSSNSHNNQKKNKGVDITKKNKKSSTDKKKDSLSSSITNLKFDVKGFSNPNSSIIQQSKNSSAATAASLIMSSQLQSNIKKTINTPTSYNKFNKNEDIELKRKQHEEKIFGSKYNNSDSNFAIKDFEDDKIQDIIDDNDDKEEVDSPTWKQSVSK